MNIEGKMIQNPISKIVYYDFLGLDYRRSAKQCLKVFVNGKQDDEFSIEYMKSLKKNIKDADLLKAKFYLEEAKETFEKAVYARKKVLNVYDVGTGYICKKLNNELARAEDLLENVKQV